MNLVKYLKMIVTVVTVKMMMVIMNIKTIFL